MSVCVMAAVRNWKPKVLEGYMFERKLKMVTMKRDGNNRYYYH